MDTPPNAENATPETVPGPAGDAIVLWLLAAMAYLGPELAAIVRAALARHLETGRPILGETWLLDNGERADLADLIGSVVGPSSLAGRARLHGAAGDVPVKAFRESIAKLSPMRPERAVKYFAGLRPELGSTDRLAEGIRRQSFKLAVSTEIQLTRAIQREITGEIANGTPSYRTVEKLIRTYGDEPRHRQYADMVARTNVMDALNQGQWDELQRPGMHELFPVWQYHAIRDERVRPWHAARDGRYWPIGVPFAEVRGTTARDVCNCRCNWTAVHRMAWARLRAGGENIEPVRGISLAA